MFYLAYLTKQFTTETKLDDKRTLIIPHKAGLHKFGLKKRRDEFVQFANFYNQEKVCHPIDNLKGL